MTAFDGKVVLITGGTRGIGRACAAYFAGRGAQVAICGRSLETATAAANELGHGTRAFQADMADPDAPAALIASVEDAFGPVAILVNNAGLARDTLLMRMKDDDWAQVIDTDLTGVFRCCRAVVRGMMKQRWGRIINISSVIGIVGQAGQANYAAAKAGLLGLTRSLARELGSRNITVNAVAPGLIETDMTAVIQGEMREAMLARIPLGRAGHPEEIAGLVGYLASESAAYITGATIAIDGGLTMH
ncbi:MAG TPA: 3-oxoacyl-[acyl-carrier-protein] reductase [Candidatus Hydrogenedentes bacterium]|jgi:3-oxoacyl-[acyl-carrier protein] reductase|nr:3-oxoacyl-[acyl-carrier-protein] reductase [Candidatus Hydrogenedentota bacterium]MDY0033717.1 3-oxoacyl-[acyl-carrier-protein] reductase [FCB group bacterium]NLT62788.1 3-oxoacyl-[acyl-carrier-protein] reductase [Candidatus Hydrogenedentota bacterium]HNZ20025.1 3-oxoacyl-[acyl-carrier-protein] reductase [Candidatus Hydrogenedentota bacterium]HOH34331.1 3-oxoacyl-[acyl-carrier-protein] reductase [Candidatus Hydrogenedentota bacterium]